MHSNKNRRTTAPQSAHGAAAGFTIIETVIALCIMLVVGFGAVSLFLFSANFNSGASDRARALALAQQTMEAQRSKTFDTLAIADTTQTVDLGSTAASVSDRRTFNLRTKVEYDTAVTGNKQKIVTITVTPANAGRWTGGPVVLRMLRTTDLIGSL
jgi:Tfp pilus assembly protein PilV